MPYSSNADLPAGVRNNLPSHGQRIWRKAHNAAMQQYSGSEEKAAAVAWAAVKNVFEKNAAGRWVKKKDHDDMRHDQQLNAISYNAGDACTIDGCPGTLREVNGGLVCMPAEEPPRKDSITVPAGTYPLGAWPEGMECVLAGGEIGRLVKEDTMLVCRPCQDSRAVDETWMGDRDFTAAEREEAVKKGYAMPGGGYPIITREDLGNARQALGRASNRSAVIAHIKKRAKALGVDLPEDWPNDAAALPDGISLFDHHVVKDGDSWSMTDTIVLDRTRGIHHRNDGYMAATPRVARTGIQLYRGAELGDMRPVVRVYRPPAAVFNRDSMSTFSSRPITKDHPPEMVTADNWKQYAMGYTGEDVVRDGEFIRVPMTLCDGQTIREFNDGVRELSVGYSCGLDFTPGKTADGFEYDAAQKDIKVNHIAFVARARGGSKLTFGDSNPQHGGEEMMNLRTVTVDGVPVQLPETAADLILRSLALRDAQIAKYRKDQEEDEDNDAEEDKKQKKKNEEDAATIATLTKQVGDLKAQLTPAAMDARVREFADAMAKAKAILGDINLANKDVAEIKRMVVIAKVGDEAAKWSEDGINASFRTLTAGAPSLGYRDAAQIMGGGMPNSGGQPPAGGFSPGYVGMAANDKAYYQMIDRAQNEWRSWGADPQPQQR